MRIPDNLQPLSKKCAGCKEVKEASLFPVVSKRTGKVSSYCLICKRQNWLNWKNNLNKEQLAHYAKYKRNKRLENKEYFIEQFGNKCADCNLTYPSCAYDFHHSDPKTKDIEPGLLFARSRSVIAAELSKCVMLCANCHRIRHWKLGDLGIAKAHRRARKDGENARTN